MQNDMIEKDMAHLNRLNEKSSLEGKKKNPGRKFQEVHEVRQRTWQV